MRMFRIKMTAARTNPQQIREVRIDSEKTVGELLELVRIVYEYGDVRGSLLNEAGASQSPETKLKDRIHVRDLLTVKLYGQNRSHRFIWKSLRSLMDPGRQPRFSKDTGQFQGGQERRHLVILRLRLKRRSTFKNI